MNNWMPLLFSRWTWSIWKDLIERVSGAIRGTIWKLHDFLGTKCNRTSRYAILVCRRLDFLHFWLCPCKRLCRFYYNTSSKYHGGVNIAISITCTTAFPNWFRTNDRLRQVLDLAPVPALNEWNKQEMRRGHNSTIITQMRSVQLIHGNWTMLHLIRPVELSHARVHERYTRYEAAVVRLAKKPLSPYPLCPMDTAKRLTHVSLALEALTVRREHWTDMIVRKQDLLFSKEMEWISPPPWMMTSEFQIV